MDDILTVPGIAKAKDVDLDDSLRTLVDLTTGALSRAIANIPTNFLMISIEDLREIAKPTRLDYMFRMNFWLEFQRATNDQSTINNIRANHVFKGSNKETFVYILKNHPARLAFIIRPIKEYEDELNNMMMVASDRLWEMVNLPLYRKNQKGEKVIDVKVAELVLKTIQLLENRTKGMAVQRIASKTQSEHKHVIQAETETPAQLDSKIRELQGKIKVLPGEVIDHEGQEQAAASGVAGS